jgi:signal transduction histidine kinase
MKDIQLSELLAYFLTLGGVIGIMILVAAKDIRSKVNQTFLIFVFNLFLYIGASFMGELLTIQQAIWADRASLSVALFIPLNFYRFALTFTGKKPKYASLYNSLFPLSILASAAAFLPSCIESIQRTSYGTTFKLVGPVLLVELIFIVGVFLSCFLMLHEENKKNTNGLRPQTRLIMFGIGSSVSLNLLARVILPEFHIFAFTNTVGVPANLFFIIAIAYAILRHKMFDIRSTVLRTAGYAITILLTLVIYSSLLLGYSKLLFPNLYLDVKENIFFVGAAMILALTFKYLITGIEKITSKIFFRDRYDPQELLNQITHTMASELRMDLLGDQVCRLLNRYIHTQSDIIILDNEHIFYESQNYFKSVIPTFEKDLKKLGDELLVTDDLPEGDQKSILRNNHIDVFAVLKTHNEKIGYLLLGDKSSGASYDSSDVKTIKIVVDELAVGFQNSRSFSLVQQLSTTLQEKINQASKELNKANTKLKQNDAVKDDFISMASHQLGTPLAVIDGYISLAIHGVYGKLDDKLMIALKAGAERAQAMKSLLVDLLDISRITAGKFMLQVDLADIATVIQKEFESMKYLAIEKEVKYIYHPPKVPIPMLEIDAQKISQAAMNIIDNALYYAPGGTVDVYLGSNEAGATFKVVDNGIGVPESAKPKLFTKFFRADNARKERQNGTGIGLYLVKRIIKDHRGTLIFSSTENKGSTFGFTLPVDQAKH